ncbi:CIS tube protein [Paenibacillus sp. MMS18-CY102]|uniref:CIS tube protein n=1 Tax=Paenibacillus sp. MMS18-CY102 TaxID=2682849 RepID=UPI0013662C9B|nr:LysM peptidoglycan-binding domain-containing protein [Paenibacillus sp. MMS18-CY102]MWC27073.1 LysM peptidoglycan-binding domain-containing protein [Paenibacillus sp. MMS18-CY102]
MALEKALIQPLDYEGNPKGEAVKVLFNPTEYAIDKSNQLQSTVIPGLPAPVTQFIGGGGQTLSMELFFDTYEQGVDVRQHTGQVTGLMDMNPDLHAPPVCMVIWGKMQFKAVVERVGQRFTMFLDSGIPVRATLSVTFREYRTITEQQQRTTNQADQTKQVTVKQGETLWSISGRVYGDPGKWRTIARANGIADPRKVPAGRTLILPPQEA